ncbi:MAG: sodium-dependent transporter [Oscillospiraceae bacterium]|nr:sodium-dependent transporter [Oscillospiraceae bacterium]
MDNSRAQWSSRLGFILAAAGSAIGLGNIWKFPGRAYEGGGGIYLLIYLAMVIFFGIPLMLTELSIGRASQSNVVGAFRKLGHKRWSWVGWVGVLGAFIITCYYSHVGGWVLRYVFGYAVEAPKIYADPLGYFYATLGLGADGATFFPWVAILFAAVFMALNAVVIIRGVESGIESFNKIGMPALFVILVILLVRSLTLPGAEEGLRYMLSFDTSKLSFDTVLSALGQAFYSLSIGMAILITYGSYLPKTENLEKNTVLICAMDTIVAFLAGFIIVPAVFATLGADHVGKGGGFAFVSLAGVFEKMPGGRLFGVLFYVLLLFAALTSCISLIEGIVAFLTEHFGWERKRTTIITCAVMFLIGCLYTCTQAAYPLKGIWLDAVNGLSFPPFCDAMEYFTDRLLIPVCALGCCLFAGWIWMPKRVIAEVEQHGVRFGLKKVYTVLIRYIAPLAILLILALSILGGKTFS